MAVTWNPSDKTAGATLTNGNLTIAGTGAFARASSSFSSGKKYFEITIASRTGEPTVGFALVDAPSTYPGGGTAPGKSVGWSCFYGFRVWQGGVNSLTDAITALGVFGVGYDFSTGTFSAYLNGVLKFTAAHALSGALFPAIGSLSSALESTTATFSGTQYLPSGFSEFGPDITTVTTDTLRQLTTDTSAPVDTLRQLSGPTSVSVDTSRNLTTGDSVSIDTLRQLTTPTSVTADTLRQTLTTVSAPIDTLRRRSLPPGTLERLTVDLKSGTLADGYSVEQLTDRAIDTTFSGLIYGWPLNFTIRGKSFSPMTKRYSLQADDDISTILKRWISFPTAATDAATIMQMVATQLGKTLSINIDSHGVRRMSEQTTVMQVLSSLFGWTSEIPHQFTNVYLRGGVLNVLQRGKESEAYTLQNFKPGAISERKLDTLMDSSSWNPKIIGDPDGTYLSGTVSFNGVSLTYDNGYVVETVTSEDTTTFDYSADTPNSPDDNKYLLQKANRKNVVNSTIVTTAYNYSNYRGSEYLASEVETETMYVNSQFNSVVVRRRVTDYYPMQSGFFGSQTSEESWTYSYTFFGGQWVQMLESNTKSGTQTQVIEGRPGGPVTPRQRSGEENTPMVDIARNPISSNHIPVTDTETLQRYADGLVWLDGKTEFVFRLECYDPHIVDFDKTVSVAGQTWYLQSNQITLGPGAAAKQSLELVRWA